jgi:hypothetical protein
VLGGAWQLFKTAGNHIGLGIDPDMTLNQVTKILDDKVVQSKLDPTSVSARLSDSQLAVPELSLVCPHPLCFTQN